MDFIWQMVFSMLVDGSTNMLHDTFYNHLYLKFETVFHAPLSEPHPDMRLQFHALRGNSGI
jgi:hypothetical protein